MSNFYGLRLLLLVAPSLFLLLPSAALVVLFERISQSLFVREATRNFRTGAREITLQGPANSTSSSPGYTDVTIHEDHGPTLAYLGLSVVAMLVACVSACGMWELRRVEGSMGLQRVWVWIVLVANLVIFGAGVGVLGWASAVQASQGWNGYGDVGKGQRFTRETWVCEIDRLYPLQDWAGPSCGLAKATRFMLIPVALFALLAMATVWIIVRRRGGSGWLFGGKGRYGGFQNVYEMNPQGQLPVPQYQYQPGPQQYYQTPQVYPQPVYAAPPQGFHPVPYQPAPQMQKGEQPVFR
ncbi:hypothetical protein N0V90_004582 [Kalmusia sp. IMI 367209]|nr:hypothetical protein N0V90_004582 [Kalmusia sp. IMI 367209]